MISEVKQTDRIYKSWNEIICQTKNYSVYHCTCDKNSRKSQSTLNELETENALSNNATIFLYILRKL